ncbi:MAG: type II secretion system protein [Candidatus Gottesmanbacteria bacterium]|nr:type II secretion system protein [Candidatus Gottesmanbacteria bacterium]
MKHYLPAERRGFTLIELLVVIGILAVLLAITLIAINPARQFSQANDTKRASDVNAILNAIETNNGTPVSNCAQVGGYDTNYTVVKSATDNRITVAAPATEIAATDISVTR